VAKLHGRAPLEQGLYGSALCLDSNYRANSKGASLRVLNAHIDTKSASGKAFLGMLGVFAEFETNLRRERQMEGIAKAKKAGVYKGRPPSIDPEAVRRLKADGIPPSEIAKSLGIGRASVYRVLASKPDAESRKAGSASRKKPMRKVQRAPGQRKARARAVDVH
jgi:DNA invertase Pin-like site-specific DNA recombinase